MTRDDANLPSPDPAAADTEPTRPTDETDAERAARDAAFERHAREQARRMADQPLWVKLDWLEQAHRRVLQLAGQEPKPWPPSRDDGDGET